MYTYVANAKALAFKLGVATQFLAAQSSNMPKVGEIYTVTMKNFDNSTGLEFGPPPLPIPAGQSRRRQS